jgi:hypothetical protein
MFTIVSTLQCTIQSSASSGTSLVKGNNYRTFPRQKLSKYLLLPQYYREGMALVIEFIMSANCRMKSPSRINTQEIREGCIVGQCDRSNCFFYDSLDIVGFLSGLPSVFVFSFSLNSHLNFVHIGRAVPYLATPNSMIG